MWFSPALCCPCVCVCLSPASVSTVICSLLLALALPNLATVFSLTGALCAFPYCFMFPTLFFLRLHQPDAGVWILRGPGATPGALDSTDGTIAPSPSPPAPAPGAGAGAGASSAAAAAAAAVDHPAVAGGSAGADPSGVLVDVDVAIAHQAKNGYSSVPLASVVGSPSPSHPFSSAASSHSTPLIVGAASSSSSSVWSHVSAFFSTSTLPRSARIPAFFLLGFSSLLWVISIVVCFKDMVDTFKTDGI